MRDLFGPNVKVDVLFATTARTDAYTRVLCVGEVHSPGGVEDA
jgi:hypothetical protein